MSKMEKLVCGVVFLVIMGAFIHFFTVEGEDMTAFGRITAQFFYHLLER